MFHVHTPEPKRLSVLLAALLLLAACDRDSPVEPITPDGEIAQPAEHLARAQDGGAVVMTRNLFVGAPVEMIYAPGADIPQAAADLWAWVQSTKYEERAAAMADEIARNRPHAVGLNEVSIFNIITPCPLGPPFCPPIAEVPTEQTLDFLQVLLTKLGERGVMYQPVSVTANFQGYVPMYDAQSSTGLSLIVLADLDVILVRHDVGWSNPQNDNFDRNLIVELAGQQLEILRGWASVDVSVNGRDFRFVTTHLEPNEPDPTIQVDQANELMDVLANWTRPGDPSLPVIVTGDMNSAADGSDTPTYGNFIDAGYVDAWGPIRPGYTCCQPEHLTNTRSQLDRRYDVILLKGDFGYLLPLRTAVFAWRVGHRLRDKTPSGLWPSDHAGVVAAMRPVADFSAP